MLELKKKNVISQLYITFNSTTPQKSLLFVRINFRSFFAPVLFLLAQLFSSFSSMCIFSYSAFASYFGLALYNPFYMSVLKGIVFGRGIISDTSAKMRHSRFAP